MAIEGNLVIECGTLQTAIYVMLAAHYIFDIQYHPRVNDVLLFLQEKVLGLLDSQIKKSSVYLSVLSGIECHLQNGECNKL